MGLDRCNRPLVLRFHHHPTHPGGDGAPPSSRGLAGKAADRSEGVALHRDDLRANLFAHIGWTTAVQDDAGRREANEVVRDAVDQHLRYRAVVEPTAELRQFGAIRVAGDYFDNSLWISDMRSVFVY